MTLAPVVDEKPAKLAVKVAPELGRYLRALKADVDANPTSGKGTMYRGLRSLFDTTLAVPEHALRKATALTGDLAGVRREYCGRLRVIYLAVAGRDHVTVLYVGLRKKGDSNDAYEEFKRMLRKGTFDDQFAELGLTKPNV